MKRLLIILTCLTIIAFVPEFCQAQTSWAQTFGGSDGDFGKIVQQTTDGGYIITGHTKSYGAGGEDCWLVKTDESGTKQWDRTFGGSGGDRGNCVQQTLDGGYIIAGTTKSFGAGDNDCWLIKTDGSGIEQWNKTFGGNEMDYTYSVQQTTDGGYIVAGFTKSYGESNGDIWLLKTDGSGIEQWHKTYGGIEADYAFSVQQTTDGGYVMTGLTGSFGAGDDDVFLLKTDGSGTEQWNKPFGGSEQDWGFSVQQTTDGGYIITGFTLSYGAGNRDIWLIKTDSNGLEEWNRTFGGSNNDYGKSIGLTTDGGYIITGYTTSHGAGEQDVWLIKTDNTGTEQWNQTFGGENMDEGWGVQQTPDGGYIIVGITKSFGAGDYDVWLIKTDASGSTAIQDNNLSETINTFTLYQNYPNPFNPITTIFYTIKKSSRVYLKIYNLLGKEIITLVDTHQDPGTYTVSFNASDLAGGIYYYQLKTNNDILETKKMIVLK